MSWQLWRYTLEGERVETCLDAANRGACAASGYENDSGRDTFGCSADPADLAFTRPNANRWYRVRFASSRQKLPLLRVSRESRRRAPVRPGRFGARRRRGGERIGGTGPRGRQPLHRSLDSSQAWPPSFGYRVKEFLQQA